VTATREPRTATRHDVGRLAEALAAAFYDDPVLAWLIPNRRSRRARLRRFFQIELRDLGLNRGAVWTTDDCSGASVCLPPGRWRLPPSVAISQGPAYVAAFGLRLPLASALMFRLEQRHLRDPHYYFAAIGVVPESQGQGLGSALMRPTLDLCDRDGLPAYLEASSPRSAKLYRRLGFEDREEFRFAGSPPIWLMERSPRG
jgi:GNAT superfamily N-acetyltransferase